MPSSKHPGDSRRMNAPDVFQTREKRIHMASRATPRLAGAFQNAKQEFLASLKDPDLLNSVSNIKSIDEVYAFTCQLQNDQSKRQGLRNLSKIKPYLDRLKEYATIIEVFVQAKPDILALIWGPIKFLLQISDNSTQSFDAIVEAISGIGNKLPIFEAYTNMFKTSVRVLDVLVLFYKDILDFYEIVLNFFSAKRWVIIFDSVWPRYKAKINLVVSSIERHSILMTEEVTLANITEAHTARVADVEHWKRTFDFQERQDFDSVYSYISPNLYDDELDKFRRRTCERTGKWLQREQALKDWIDTSNAATRIVWMQGIPGAGKTYIASMMVERLRQSSKTVLFAFLSYTEGDVIPVSVIHSLIFQLAIGEDHFDDLLKRDLRAKICSRFRSNQRNLKSSTGFACEVLTELLKCVGPAYIILDGLDEISNDKHLVDILDELLKVLENSTELKLFISSRAEDEIDSMLKNLSPRKIRVDEKNTGCIHAYVEITTDKWLEKTGFEQNHCDEIRVLLQPLSTKARGMFLYARVVMANVVDMYTLDMIKDELRVLPEDLDEAYSRALNRLNSSNPSSSSKRMCRRALGWIGCTPVSITLEELSSALSIDPDGKRDLPPSSAVVNLVKLCGPIVEVTNGYVNFVHFTVKEYLFEKKEDAFLNALDPTIEMTRTCLHYLSSDIFDIGNEDSEIIEQNILCGLYRFYWFAATQWIALLQECERLLGSRDFPEPLVLALKRFSLACQNGNFQSTVDLTNDPNFSALKLKEPEIHGLLVQELHFRRMDVGDWKLKDNDEDDSWTSLDPFYLSFMTMLIHGRFENLLCPKEPQDASRNYPKLKALYGERLFRCNYSICQPLRTFFASRSDRDAHCRNHGRAYKCPHPSCDFSTMGFSSASQLEKHKGLCHLNAPLKAIQVMKNPEKDEIVPLVSDIIAMGMSAELKVLQPKLHLLSYQINLDPLVKESAFCGKLEIFQQLWKHHRSIIGSGNGLVYDCGAESIRGENVEVLEYLIRLMDITKYTWSLVHYMRAGANSDSTLIYAMWKEQADQCIASVLLSGRLFSGLTTPDKQERFAAILDGRASRGHFSQDQLSSGLKALASTSCAPSVASVLLKHGAFVDFRRMGNDGAELCKTPLLWAAGKSSKDAAELMKLLLLAGADPNASYFFVKKGGDRERHFASTQNGARNVSKWLGLSWSELVEITTAERSKSEKPRTPVLEIDNVSD